MGLGNDLKSFEKLLASILVVSALCLLTTCSNAKVSGKGGSVQGGEKSVEQLNSDECGGPNNSCYALPNLEPGDRKTITGTTEKIEYTTIGDRGYWKSLTADRILNFTGFWDPAKNLRWQMKLEPGGRNYDTSTYLVFRDLFNFSGRACPGKVFTGLNDEGEAGRCFDFISFGASSYTLVGGSIPSTWNQGKWFLANHSECAKLGMRLPTLYEMEAFKDSSLDDELPANAQSIRSLLGKGIEYESGGGGYQVYKILTATTGKKAACGAGANDCYSGVSKINKDSPAVVSTTFDPRASADYGLLYCVLH